MSLADKGVDLEHLVGPVRQRMYWATAVMKQLTGIDPTLTSGYRSIEKQAQLYADRASNPYPVNKPGDSAHNYGLAFDSDVPDAWMPAWTWLRQYAGFRVPENDVVHAEVPNWRNFVK